jgi:hypothetical protein
MQDKDKSLMKELMKSDHKYELTKIERTAVLTLNGKLFIPTAIRNSVPSVPLSSGRYVRRSKNPGHYDVVRIN